MSEIAGSPRTSALGYWVSIVAAISMALLHSSPGHGQSLEVYVREGGTQSALPGTSVAVSDSLGRIFVTEPTPEVGPLEVELPFGGSWSLTARHYGFDDEMKTVLVEDGEEVSIVIELSPAPVPLDEIYVDVDRRCPEESGEPAVARIWHQARTILLSATNAANRTDVRFQVVTEDRHFKPWESMADLEGARDDNSWNQYYDTVWVDGSVPFREPDPHQLLTQGFIVPLFHDVEKNTEFEYYIPGPRTILSTAFLESHCFSIVEQGGMEDWIGLAFAPDRNASLTYDVEGTFWLPRNTGVLPRIDFRHTSYPHEQELWAWDWASSPLARPASLHDRVGGSLELSYLPGVGWFTHYFSIRWPMIRWREAAILDAPIRNRLPPGHAHRANHRDFTRKWVWFLSAIMDHEARVTKVQLPDTIN